MLTKGKIFLSLVILAVITAAAILRFTLYSDAASKYSSDSNKQLQSTALGLVKKIRELVDSYNKRDRELTADYQTNYLATRTTERQTLRDQYEKNMKNARDATIRDYKEKLLAESKTVRQELQRRLPERMQRPQLSKTYENPSVALELEIIAGDLDRLSRSLPGNWSVAELKQKATDLVVQLRSFIKAAQKERTDLDLACTRERSSANTDERQNQIRERCNNDAIKLSENHVAIYNERFKAEAIFLRGESLFRLPKEYRSKIAPPVIFEFPQNLTAMEMIAANIELLGKSLTNGDLSRKLTLNSMNVPHVAVSSRQSRSARQSDYP
jgi:hypothetical protein